MVGTVEWGGWVDGGGGFGEEGGDFRGYCNGGFIGGKEMIQVVYIVYRNNKNDRTKITAFDFLKLF